MNIKVLGSSGAEFPNYRPPAYLIDNFFLLDAGTIGSVLPDIDQWKIKTILLSHSHLDHIKGIPFLADNIIISNVNNKVRLISTCDVLNAVSKHIFNNVIWPDFSKIPSTCNPVIEYVEIPSETEMEIDGYSITAIPVNHSVPAIGYLIKKGPSALLYTGDTGPTDKIWRYADKASALIVEVSFPNQMNDMALLTGHLTPSLLLNELSKCKAIPPLILVTHTKPQFREEIMRELRNISLPEIKLLCDEDEYII
ncbi:3',5'-cyclic-nucleotide phosphodiesterase [Geobacter pelophilus]|uniref:3',5'-cyclic-nucleotide phosphodiesterase n=1 Tax=Geoanaerobacter pelophilus TaxID=60036 RepID=A0AAW4L8S2_9BACT|nr:3',5'-cyclic-nucleotide phosphodiesterase [Geoanaerobacter pelophilus]MBT0665960.1 3',5'-cyclic-nucleotide phosphodiesterase [Geoanaerobacter pelophilus]